MKTESIALHRRPLYDGHPLAQLRQVFFGHPLRNSGNHNEKLGFWLGLPLLAVDALSSVAYATEEILLALSIGSSSLFSFSVPIAISIVFLMVVLIASYRQTIDAYPHGGGAYTVSKENLGVPFGLVAASSLLLDYILTVAVSVTAGVRAICSAYPYFLPYQTRLCIVGIFILCWLNLRGVRESAGAIALPVYGFIVSMMAVGAWGLWTGLSVPDGVVPTPVHGPADVILSFGVLTILLRAFAGGCTAMTGVEAIANAGNILEKPSSHVAKHILVALGCLLGTLFLSITVAVSLLGIQPSPSESLISLLLRHLWGSGIVYQTIQILTASVLFLAANTAFAGAPRLTAILAKDGWLPKQLYAVGDRLVFNQGIVWLAVFAVVLVALFNGDVHKLIPLYAIGVFTAFTLSQSGMVRYWASESKRWSDRSANQWMRLFFPPWIQRVLGSPKLKASLNCFGAVLTGIALCITFESKFFEGSFIILIFVPLCMYCFYTIKAHYDEVRRLSAAPDHDTKKRVFAPGSTDARTIVVPVSSLHRGSYEALAFAREMSPDVRAIIVNIDRSDSIETKEKIDALGWGIQSVILSSPYRSIVTPIIQFVQDVDAEKKGLSILVLPELVPPRWWQNILHNQTAKAITQALSWSEQLRNQARIIINVPYYLKKD